MNMNYHQILRKKREKNKLFAYLCRIRKKDQHESLFWLIITRLIQSVKLITNVLIFYVISRFGTSLTEWNRVLLLEYVQKGDNKVN